MEKNIRRLRELPISEYQKRFFFEWVLAPDAVTYNVSYLHKIIGGLDEKALRKACEMFISQNEVVQVRFSEDGEICYHGEFTIDDFYLEALFNPGIPLEQQVGKFLYCPFDLTKGPILKLCLMKSLDRGKPEFYFFFVTHHIICDAVFISQLYGQIQQAYNALSVGSKNLPNVPKTFSLAVQAECKVLNKQYKLKARKFWLDFIGDIPLTTALPYQTNSLDHSNTLGEFIYFDLSSEESEKVRNYAKAKGTTVFVVLSSFYGLVLSKYISQDFFFLNYSVMTRPDEFLEVAGCFMNNVPMKFELREVDMLDELINQINQQRKSVKPFQRYTLGDIVQDQRLLAGKTANIVNIGFAQSYLNVIPFELQGLTTQPVDITWSTNSIYEIGMLYDERSDVLRFKLEYRKTFFDGDLIRQLIRSFVKIIQGAVGGDKIQIKSYTVLPEETYSRLVYDWNATDREYERSATICELFERQVERTPDG
ncbi:hypothetical protein J2X69_005106, partial [Algoriphagus sp. 4150]|uniref:condensation domain-containing protein n=1 Tax=Algoriphagus sp. 4150 TaxID=2817756 RepID=UPI00285E2CA7